MNLNKLKTSYHLCLLKILNFISRNSRNKIKYEWYEMVYLEGFTKEEITQAMIEDFHRMSLEIEPKERIK